MERIVDSFERIRISPGCSWLTFEITSSGVYHLYFGFIDWHEITKKTNKIRIRSFLIKFSLFFIILISEIITFYTISFHCLLYYIKKKKNSPVLNTNLNGKNAEQIKIAVLNEEKNHGL